MKRKYRKEFGENPEEIMVLATKVFFGEDGIATVENEDVAEVLDSVPGYSIVEDEEKPGESEKTPEAPLNEQISEEVPDEDKNPSSEDDEPDVEDQEEAPEAPAEKVKPRPASVRKPSTPKAPKNARKG